MTEKTSTSKKYSAVQIPTDGNSMSKQDEIDLLNKIAQALPANTYLAGLLSNELIRWVSGQIKDDFPCDIWHTQQVQLDADREAIARRDAEINRLTGTVTMLNLELESSRSQYHGLAAQMQATQETLETKRQMVRDLSDKLAYAEFDAEAVRDQAVQTEAQLRRTVEQLKARIFDLEHPEFEAPAKLPAPSQSRTDLAPSLDYDPDALFAN